ncbi:MAG: insulinase family protein [Prevotellaceae bacterium]|jgi:predicted Zn-dependent peptidase|nr:insulinase family protein [Prevotellaceae bacterium]
MEIETFTLPNGLRFVHKRVQSAVAYCGLTVDVGARDELKPEHGMAHFLEHMLFRGTKRRTSMQISTLLEDQGGDLNAFTTKEETAVHAVVLLGDLSKAFDIIADIVLNPTFPPDELEKEKDVVCDEINLYFDNPSDLIFDDFEELMFPTSSLGRSILGSERSLSRFSQEDLRRFSERCYATGRMAFASVGDFSISKVEALAERYFAKAPRAEREVPRVPPEAYCKFRKKRKRSTYQAHCLLGNRTFSYAHERRYALYLLANMLGGPSQNSLLNLALRETHGLAYGVEVAATLYSDCGAATIYFGTDKRSVNRCLQVVEEELVRLCTDKLPEARLLQTQKQLLGQLAIGEESSEQVMLGLGKSMLAYGKVSTFEEVAEHIRAVTPEQLRDVAREVFTPQELSLLTYV